MDTGGPSELPVARSYFQQQGTVDWVNLGREIVSYSVNVLHRLSQANVDPYTVTVGQAMCQNLRFAGIGHQNVNKAMASLKSFGSIGDVLWFGFGIKTFPRILGRTDQGRTLLALSAALSECFHEDLAEEVLHEMAIF